MARRKQEEEPFEELSWAVQWMDEDDLKDVIRACETLFAPQRSKPEPVKRAEFNEQDQFRAKGLGIRLD